MRCAAFGYGYFFGDPEDGTSFSVMPGQAQSKASCCCNMGLSGRRNLMQGATQEPAAKNLINGRNAQRQGVGLLFKSGSSLQSQQAVAQLCDHKPLETRGIRYCLGPYVHVLFQSIDRTKDVKPQGNGVVPGG